MTKVSIILSLNENNINQIINYVVYPSSSWFTIFPRYLIKNQLLTKRIH